MPSTNAQKLGINAGCRVTIRGLDLNQVRLVLGPLPEKVIFDDLSTGAESDIQNLTQVARGMVGRWGMSDAVERLLRDLHEREPGSALPHDHGGRSRRQQQPDSRNPGRSNLQLGPT